MSRRSFTFATAALATTVGIATTDVFADSRRNGRQNGSAPSAIVKVHLTPRFGIGPTDMQALVQVAPHPENRRLRVAIESGGFVRTSEIQLDGTESPKSHVVSWRSVPPGRYVFSAIVFGPTGPRDIVVRSGFEILDPSQP